MKYKSILFIFTFFILGCTEHDFTLDLRENANYDSIKISQDYFDVIDSNLNLNYTKTLLFTYKFMHDNANTQICATCKVNDWDNGKFAQSFSFVGDNKNAINFSKKISGEKPSIIDSAVLKNIILYEPKKYILEQFRNAPIIMFNEAHDRIQTRTLLLSMLKDLKQAGATHLAMETFSKNGNLKELDNTTGIFTVESISGQIVREAIKLGYVLISYEDTCESVSKNSRELNQAKNLLNKVAKNNGIEKTVVLAGYGHICECIIDSTNKPMAVCFSELSGVDPLTVNQTDFVEAFNPTLRPFLELIVKTKITEVKALNSNGVKSLFLSASGGAELNCPKYDIYIYFPVTEYIHNRPKWLLTSIQKDFVSVEIPENIKPVLVQAYISNEIKTDKDFNIKIPYDQTFTSENNKAWLVLEKGNTYSIVFRDEKNRVLQKNTIEK